MIKTLLTATALAAVMASASNAATANLDFVAEAAGAERGAENETINFDGLGVTLTSTADAYLDDLSSNKPAGLGVCSSGLTATAQCVDPGDDNIGVGESVTLTFDLPVLALTDFVFYDFQHNPIDPNDQLVLRWDDEIGPFTFGAVQFGEVETELSGLQGGAISSITLRYSDTQFYLGSVTAEFEPAAVPLPASIFLLGGALGGMGVMRRRRKAA